MSTFSPILRVHGYKTETELWKWPLAEKNLIKYDNLRYRLLPYIANLFWEHMRTGAPLMRPLLWHYDTDPVAGDIDDEFMFGSDILVAPILERAHEYRTVYFPEGNWYHFQTNEMYSGKSAYVVKIPLGSVPAFVREGAIIPLVEVMQHTNEYKSKSITFKVFGETASGSYFEDDGITFDYENGKYNEYLLSFAGGKFSHNIVHKGFSSSHSHNYQISGSNNQHPIELYR